MRYLRTAALLAAGVLAGCMAGGPSLNAGSQDVAASKTNGPSAASLLGVPLLIDRTDLRIGTTVQFTRAPTVGELHDLTLLPGLAHIVLTFPTWPTDFAPLQPLDRVPRGADVIVVLGGYPPNRAAVEAWSYIGAPLRIVVVVDGPPPSAAVAEDLNSMRSLERVIAQMDEPSRSGFEHLQRPLSFRKLID
jgi:hypothetical protein